ncbi:hypothetical protein M8C21_023004, partial [Ambrosia artemisiifolia]
MINEEGFTHTAIKTKKGNKSVNERIHDERRPLLKPKKGNKSVKERIDDEGVAKTAVVYNTWKVNEDDLRENIKKCRKAKARSKDVIRARTSPNKSMGFRKIPKLKMENIPGSLGLYILGQLDTDKMRINVNKEHLDVDIESIR